MTFGKIVHCIRTFFNLLELKKVWKIEGRKRRKLGKLPILKEFSSRRKHLIRIFNYLSTYFVSLELKKVGGISEDPKEEEVSENLPNGKQIMFLFSSQVHNKSSSHFPTCFILSHWNRTKLWNWKEESKNRRKREGKKKEIMDRETLFFPIETILLSPLPFYNNNDAELVADDNTALSPPKASHIKQSSLASILSPDKKKKKKGSLELRVSLQINRNSETRIFSPWRDLVFSTSLARW